MPKGIPRKRSAQGKILHRLKIARGHLDRVIKMAEEREYCIDIVHQSLAVQSALKKADQEILKNHMETCMKDAIKKGDGKHVIDEIIEVVKKAR